MKKNIKEKHHHDICNEKELLRIIERHRFPDYSFLERHSFFDISLKFAS